MDDPLVPLSALAEAALLFDARGALSSTNAAAEALDPQRLAHAFRPVVDAAFSVGSGRAVVLDPERDGVLLATARRSTDGTVLLLLVEAREAAAVERETFVANLIHELRNQAFALDIHAEDLDDGDAARAVRATGQRLARLARGLSDWIGPAAETPTSYGLRALVDEVCERLRAEHPATYLTVSGAPDEQAFGRRGRVGHALRLILENALVLTRAGTVVEVEVERAGDRRVITVRDRGPGLPRSAGSSIWEPLYRRRKGGLGLGLAIARRFVGDDGGRVRSEDAAGGGALITLELPGPP